MPELPEVETTRRGIEGAIVGQQLTGWTVRNAALRWPVELPDSLRGATIDTLSRRGKYLLFQTADGGLILHLGMSGSLRVVGADQPVRKHDHIDLHFGNGACLRLHDPRRFGSLHYAPAPLAEHFLLRNLGVEPLGEAFTGEYLKTAASARRAPVKNFLMDGRIVVGVGNIYANEALFVAGIRPTLAAGRVSLPGFNALVGAVRDVLRSAIQMGGTTLRDYVGGDGAAGYFKQALNVYGREGGDCTLCDTPLRSLRLGQRATVYCPKCQPSRGFRPRN